MCLQHSSLFGSNRFAQRDVAQHDDLDLFSDKLLLDCESVTYLEQVTECFPCGEMS